ncbi:uncharacterized protein NECHADRAFT_87868 [Fusarium vanettenii 77-13-4]|uniref:Uncharacterized protein n=1 Tax=Fusarium vanettenii (strain ATCC MYA-4622 / CBS 123669 / FGSC 9596 / NRRL 45880 / 77-13-4) TaxID=660122 RepID=C7Z392_FUSV7|nr:uncharacterized protein NECHADRAFT_87868 [Fusarium vanettenii 77-13-4]EEU41795.1 hypothetical protein NECHADRAFT_87868 [Fusarium vanettenii 77-13-4]
MWSTCSCLSFNLSMILGKYGELEWYWIISSSSMMHWNPASEKSTSPSPGFKRCLLVLDFSLNFGNLTFTSNFDLLINMPEITENTPPSLLAQLSVLALQPYASLSGVLALMIILAIFKAVFDQDEKLIPGYAAVEHKQRVGLMPGMAGFLFDVHSSEVFKGVVRTQLTQSLGRITAALSSETAAALEEYFPPRNDWQECVFYPTTVDLVFRLSARVFLGEGICRNKGWLKVSGAYAVEGIEFTRVLRFWKPIVRPIVQFFLSERLQMMKSERVARRIINEELERRCLEQTEGARAGRPVRKYDDALQWLQDWSVLKESQRRNPVHLTIMTRIAEGNVTFSDGLKVRKGDMLTVTTPEVMMDSELFPELERFIGDRFLKLR